MDDDDFLEGGTERLLADLPFEMADRLPDDRRQMYGKDAAVAEWDLLIQSVAGEAVLHGLALTPEEKDLLVRGLRWVGEPHDLAGVTVVGPVERAELSARWRFEPAPPAGDRVEAFLVEFCRQEPEAQALVTAWRHGPEGRRDRIRCLVAAAGADPGKVWGVALSRMGRDIVPFSKLVEMGVLVEAVAADGQWPAYHRRLMRAATPVWVEPGFSLGEVVAAQPRPLTLVRLGDDDLVFPGLPDHDVVDALVAGWAAHAEGVVAAVRAWAQPGAEGEGDDRTRVYGVLAGDAAGARSARQACVELVGRATGGPVAIEVAVLSGTVPGHLRRLFDTAVVLWEQAEPPGVDPGGRRS